MRPRALGAFAIVLFSALAHRAGAQGPAPAPASSVAPAVEGTVLAIEGGDLVLDLGTLRGARTGDVVEIWRPLRIKHPVTG
ncbi:MAG: hypothetical protein JWM74_3212, partial [Myxococcaceae bacterium]|nr:hypothetical protein [Myxococcaceae bacterium]